ncbi:MAG: putative phage abortive infection protein [Candidatus Thiodiazotropha sp. (ex. Lucinisca nassula)]|nr:putative phage abortive infection protein [Candidatus Thiodiazotropha sp. (ex. Lucinisca nassula)]
MTEEKTQKSEQGLLSKYIILVLVILFVVALVSATVVIYFYATYYPGEIVANHSKWGTMGDFFGGTLNPIFGFIGLFALLLTIAIQNKELANSTKELATSASALKEQSTSLKTQNFENTFFQMLRLHNDIVNDMFLGEPQSADKGLNGRDCFEEYYGRYKAHYNRSNATVNDSNDFLGIIEDGYKSFFSEQQADIGHYFRNLYTIIKFVNNSDIENKKQYVSMVRAQLSSYELALLFYNCLWSVGRKKFKDLIEKYELLENMSVELLTNPKDQLPLYNKGAYGDLEIPDQYKQV